ncbi:MAG: cytochrome C oxidase subunit IV family protein [Nitrolancea sp.]
MSSESGSEVVHSYPEPSTYIKLAVFLAIFTIIEVATYYIDAPVLLITLVLLVLMAVKFVLVVGYYMHLKFDSRLLTLVFAGGLTVGLSIMLVMIALFGNF